MKNIPTAEELASSIYQPIGMSCNEFAIKLAIEFAKFHVEEALKAASESRDNFYKGDTKHYNEFSKDAIINAYPLTNIK